MFSKILVAMDNSASSQTIFESALVLAKATEAELMLLHVLSLEEEGTPVSPLLSSLDYYTPVNDDIIQIYRKQWETFENRGLDLLRSRTDEATSVGVKTEFTQTPGSPGRTICELAQNWGADLIVMGRRGRSGLSELILGSVSNYVTHHAHCSVLTVQGKANSCTEVAQENQELSVS